MCKITHCVKLHSVCKSTHFRICVNYTLFCKTAHFVQYQSSFFHVSIQKFYTWLIFFTQPAVVMVVTNMKYASLWSNVWMVASLKSHSLCPNSKVTVSKLPLPWFMIIQYYSRPFFIKNFLEWLKYRAIKRQLSQVVYLKQI